MLPWVLRDYTSSRLDLADQASYRDFARPVGAQTEARRELFRERYSGWADPEVNRFYMQFYDEKIELIIFMRRI